MSNVRLYSPFGRYMLAPMEQMDRFVSDLLPRFTATSGIDVYEDEKSGEIVVKAAVPGIKPEDLNITYEDGVLRIQGEAKETEEEKESKIIYSAERITKVDYTTTLPRPIDTNSIAAVTEHGVAKITAKISEDAKPKKITVSAK